MPNAADLAEQGFERALLLRSVRRFEDALRERDGCLAIDPEHGRSLRQLGRFEEAATQAQKAIAAADRWAASKGPWWGR